jgi:phage-related protein
MPKTNVLIYQESSGEVPLLKWLDGLSPKVQDKCYAAVGRLGEKGHDLRRPTCDFLERKIWELRARYGNVHYRILYTFVGRRVVLLSHGCSKKKRVPKSEIDRAVRRREKYIQNPRAYAYTREQ